MEKSRKISLFLLRLSLGWLYFYAGITKVLDPKWSAAGYLNQAKAFSEFYSWLANPNILPVVNFLNEWGLTFLGISLILGVAVRLSSTLGIVLMAMYYFPLGFPYPNPHSLIVDEHVIYASALFLVASYGSGQIWNVGGWLNQQISKKYPKLAAWLN